MMSVTAVMVLLFAEQLLHASHEGARVTFGRSSEAALVAPSAPRTGPDWQSNSPQPTEPLGARALV